VTETIQRHLWVLVALGAVAACAAPQAAVAPRPSGVCEARDTALVRDVLYFGRNRPTGGEVADAD
jgi:hypothetical protein